MLQVRNDEGVLQFYVLTRFRGVFYTDWRALRCPSLLPHHCTFRDPEMRQQWQTARNLLILFDVEDHQCSIAVCDVESPP